MPNIEIPIAELQKNKLFFATPCYGGQCSGLYARSLADLSAITTHYKIPLQIYLLFKESLITRARNYAVDEFMRSDATHMIFVDADIGFDAKDVLALLALQRDDSPYDIIGAGYPKKCISWEKIKVAVDKGFADENPSDLEKFVGDYVFNPKGGQTEIRLSDPVEVLEIGTGFMMIRKKTLEKFQEAYPQYVYKPDHVRSEHFDGTREITQYFQAEIDSTGRYLSEDYWFCQKTQAIGLQTWLCPWMKLSHIGTFVFGGSLEDLARIQVPATADINMLGKKK